MWRAFCETLRDCGRNGGFFLVAVLCLPLVVTVINFCLYLCRYLGPILTAGFGLGGLALLVLTFQERRKMPSADIAELPPLSHADCQIARSKLLKDRTK